MWTHYCIVDRAWISVGKNEPCNWCGKWEAGEKQSDATLSCQHHKTIRPKLT